MTVVLFIIATVLASVVGSLLILLLVAFIVGLDHPGEWFFRLMDRAANAGERMSGRRRNLP